LTRHPSVPRLLRSFGLALFGSVVIKDDPRKTAPMLDPTVTSVRNGSVQE
jgi:hypothetical protein